MDIAQLAIERQEFRAQMSRAPPISFTPRPLKHGFECHNIVMSKRLSEVD